jgi:nucleoside-diphosphate kinase
MAIDYALALAKPDAVRRGLVGVIISRLEDKVLSLVDLTVKYPTRAMIEAMYADKKDEPDFPSLLEYMLSGPVVAMLWQGEEANKALRLVVGSKDPLESPPGSLRGDYAGDPIKTLVHGSRNPDEAYSEALLWFPERFGAEPVQDGKSYPELPASRTEPLLEATPDDPLSAWKLNDDWDRWDPNPPMSPLALNFLKSFAPEEQ